MRGSVGGEGQEADPGYGHGSVSGAQPIGSEFEVVVPASCATESTNAFLEGYFISDVDKTVYRTHLCDLFK